MSDSRTVPSTSYAPSPYLRRREAAAYLGVSAKTLANWASAGAGPSYSRAGGVVVYARAVLDAFLASSTVQTSGTAA